MPRISRTIFSLPMKRNISFPKKLYKEAQSKYKLTWDTKVIQSRLQPVVKYKLQVCDNYQNGYRSSTYKLWNQIRHTTTNHCGSTEGGVIITRVSVLNNPSYPTEGIQADYTAGYWAPLLPLRHLGRWQTIEIGKKIWVEWSPGPVPIDSGIPYTTKWP